jgi:hypothetical protein
MKRLAATTLGVIILLFTAADAATAQVKRIEMKIDGYLCGN